VFILSNKLRKYQREIAACVLDSVWYRRGLTFTVEIARQGGKNELSSQIELILLSLFVEENKNLIKCSPTFKPQTLISIDRLKEKLNDAGFQGCWESEFGYIIKLGCARAIFLSADKDANVVGNTAHLLLEVDEAQDVSEEKFNKDFRPMGSTTNATTVLYGTSWDNNTLLENVKQQNLLLERKDGVRRHFRYDWQEVAKYNPEYRAYVETEKERLGENHPLFLTQYRLLPLSGGGGFFNIVQKAQLQGDHSRRRHSGGGKVYVAGLDLAGEAEKDPDELMNSAGMKRDSTVITIGELEFSFSNNLQSLPLIKIVEHYVWTGCRHSDLYARMVDILGTVWQCRRVAVDATGVGQPIASFLKKSLGSKIIPFNFTRASKSKLGFNLLAAVNAGRLKMYLSDDSPEYREFWFQIEKARGLYHPSQMMNFYVDSSEGHDDYLMSAALLVEAAGRYETRSARGR
jgi:hypothetical protein